VTTQEIFSRLQSKFEDNDISIETEAVLEPFIVVPSSLIALISEHLCRESDLAFDSLQCLSGVDLSASDETMEIVYHLFSMTHQHNLTLKIIVPKVEPHVPTVEHVWKIANWHEREVYDLYGVVFDGHSDLRRILLPDDWEGHPMRKDYKEPEIYRGMKVPY
jgi:NADH-quinone oxidoreductase subunit C